MYRALKKEFPAVVRLAVFIFVRAIGVLGVHGGAVREDGSEKCAILYLKMRGVPLPFKANPNSTTTRLRRWASGASYGKVYEQRSS